MQYFIRGNYYFDIDLNNQLRIAGPQNHLLLGMAFPKDVVLTVVTYRLQKSQLVISLSVDVDTLVTSLPLVTDIRTLRSHIEPVVPKPSYQQLVNQGVIELLPSYRKPYVLKGNSYLRFWNEYVSEEGKINRYGAEISFPSSCTYQMSRDHLVIKGDKPLRLTIRTYTNIGIRQKVKKKLFYQLEIPAGRELDPEVAILYQEAGVQIEHLIRTNKTSSFEYGTLFPRDWIESADLGMGDLTANAVDYMYQQSLENVSTEGEGWHEDLVGNYRYKIKDVALSIDRKMIDIEPRYILGMERMSRQMLTRDEIRQKLRLIALYILRNAKTKDLITFKKVPNDPVKYHFVGNWRDSFYAFPRQQSPLAPYDVNCVLYPQALRILRTFRHYFQITQVDHLNELITKWDDQKGKFRLIDHEGLLVYSLALHGTAYKPLEIAHLDESYDLFYGIPSLEEVASFAKRVQDPNYFYTPVGPILVGAHEELFGSQHYHGKVIWPKQAAYVVAGLTRQYQRGLQEHWPWPVIELIKEAVLQTASARFRGWKDLGAVPELYYFDESSGKARFYTDQKNYEGQMSVIQLWSSVGCRRIVRDYLEITQLLE